MSEDKEEITRFEFDQLAGTVQGDHARVRALEIAFEGMGQNLKSISGDQTELKEALTAHMSKEEDSDARIYDKIEGIDREVAASFKERDGKIASMDKSTARLLGVLFGGFTVLNLAITIGVAIWSH